MKILVPVKGVDLNNVKMSMNPFCEIAVEEAIRIKESGKASEVIVVSIGTSKAEEQIRYALALGADRGILVETEEALSSLNVAKTLKNIVDKEAPKLIIMGKQSIDSDNNQTGQMLAALAGIAQGTFASKVEMKNDTVEVTREVDGGLQTLALKLPAVITSDLRLNEPRYAKLPDIMKAKKKPMEKVALSSLLASNQQQTKVSHVEAPAQRQAGIKVNSVSELIDKLKNEAKVLP